MSTLEYRTFSIHTQSPTITYYWDSRRKEKEINYFYLTNIFAAEKTRDLYFHVGSSVSFATIYGEIWPRLLKKSLTRAHHSPVLPCTLVSCNVSESINYNIIVSHEDWRNLAPASINHQNKQLRSSYFLPACEQK